MRISFLLLVLLMTLRPALAKELSPRIDSLIKKANNSPKADAVRILAGLVWDIRQSSPDKGIAIGSKAIEIASEINDHESICKIYGYMAVCERNLGNTAKSLDYSNLGLTYAISHDLKTQEVYFYNNIGNIFSFQGSTEQSITFLNQAARLATEIGDSADLANSYINLSHSYLKLKDYDKAMEYIEKSKEILTKNNDDKQSTAYIDMAKGEVYYEKGIIDSAKTLLLSTYRISDANSDQFMMANLYNSLSNIYLKQSNYDSALVFARMTIESASMINSKMYLQKGYEALGNTYLALGNYKEAENNFQKQIIYHDSLCNSEVAQYLVDIECTINRLQKEKELRTKMDDQQYQAIFLTVMAILLVVSFCIPIKLFNSNQKTKNLNNQLGEQEQLITSGIKYAHRIQLAINPELSKFGSFFAENFVLYKPRDIVSGDFFWQYDDDEHQIIAVADCTGHGVPGAFLTMLGTSILQEAAVSKLRSASDILEQLRSRMKTLLNQNYENKGTTEGMDLALLIVEKKTMMADYSGAYIPLVYIRDNKLVQLNANRNPIAWYYMETPFKSQQFQLMKGDCIYMATDGFTSQFSEDMEKLQQVHYRDLLMEVHSLPMNEQKDKINEFFLNWKQSAKQIDDVLVVGLKV